MPRMILAVVVIGCAYAWAGSAEAASLSATGPASISAGEPLTLSVRVTGSDPASGLRLVVDTGADGPPVTDIVFHHSGMVFEESPNGPVYYDEFMADLTPPSPYAKEIYTWEFGEPEPWPTRALDGLLATVHLDTSNLQPGSYTIRFEHPETNDYSVFVGPTFGEPIPMGPSTPFQFQVNGVNGVPAPGVFAQLVGLAASGGAIGVFWLRRHKWTRR